MMNKVHQSTVGRTVLCGALALMCATALTACEQPDWENPEYISKRLQEGDATDRQIALDKLGALDEEKQKEAVPALVKVYMDEGQNQEKAMQLLVRLRVPEAKEAYVKEVKENPTDYAAAAAEALGEAGVKDALPDMIALYKSTDDMDLKQGLVRAFAYIPDPQMVPVLTDTLELDVDNYPIALHSYSCEILGDIAQKAPQTIDDRAKQAMIQGLFVGNMAGQTVSKECGLAIQQLGQPAVPMLIKTFKGENEAVNTLLVKYNKPPEYKFPENRVKAVAAARLGALKADEAVDVFMADLKSTKEAGEQLSGQHAVSWRVNEGQATSEIINALGDIGDAKAVELLEKIVAGEYTEDEWDEITDWMVELQLRQDAGFALARLGDREGADALIDAAKDGVIIDMEKRAAMVEKAGQPMGILQRYQFNWMSAQAYTFLAGADGLDAMVSLIKETKEPELKKKYKSFLPALEKSAACLGEDADEGKAKCFGKMLGGEDKLLRKKAAYELSRLPSKVAGPVVNEHLSTEDLEVREVLTFASYRVPNPKMVDTINTILEEEADMNDMPHKMDHNRLKLLRAWLKNNSGAVAQK